MSFLSHFIGGKFRRPDGLAGRWVSTIMRKRNREPYEWTLSTLDIRPDDHVLEIGFGPGYGLSRVLSIVRQGNGTISGVDFSKTMCDTAARAIRREAGADGVVLKEGEASALPFDDNSFTKVFAVNVLYFWPDLVPCFQEVFRVTAPGGKITFFYADKDSLQALPLTRTGHFHFWNPSDTAAAAQEAGFVSTAHGERHVKAERERLGRLISATKPE